MPNDPINQMYTGPEGADPIHLMQAHQAQAQAAREEAEALAAETEEDLALLSDEAIEAIGDSMTSEHWNRVGAVIFASDLSIIIESDNGIEPSLDNILVLAKFIETGDVLP